MKMKFFFKQIAVVSVTMTLAASLVNPTIAFGASNVQETVSARTEKQLLEKWQKYLPLDIDSSKLFEVAPTLSAPYSAGKVSQNVLLDGLNATNFARYLAGLPDDVTLDYSIAEKQQAGAIINAINGSLTHYPVKPSDMSESFYQLAAASAGSSNLSAGRDTLYDTVFYGYMSDNGNNNLLSVGHRRWIINPQMKKTMFGFAVDPSSVYGTYSSMSAFNNDRDINEVQYDYIAWPSAGIFPAEIIRPADPWSVSLNTGLYDRNKISDIKVTLTRERDQKVWNFDSNDRDYDGDFFNVSLNNYGINFAVIFRPGNIDYYEDEDKFNVNITGLHTLAGESTSLSYSTSLVQLQSKFVNSAQRYMLPGQQLQFPVDEKPIRYVSSDPRVASVNANGVVTAHKRGYVNITVDGYLYTSNSSIQIDVLDKPESPISSWAQSSLTDANKYGLLNFNPYYYDLTESVTRELFVSYVVGLLTAIDPTIDFTKYYDKASPFTDVYDGNYEIIWAYENNIINGTGNGKFSPYATISREQAASLLMKVYHYLDGNLKRGKAPVFSDDAKISAWARSSVTQAAELSIMGGVSATKFDPQGKYSHEQTIVTMVRLFNMLGQ
ncbi:MAG: S-layer homology domain-containing protein [Candidatus Pristimantibacillus lignocellulolyticus]|uniref:S-layer homology domain-containing protein n=1 Tax=Candidatus Pristimantibacillus lignocellulolyticus TaxID=2994561 RepID=A0A9J6Z8R8_9BACL|nr:MAG: S-layer homology domain-containing protein [Candidatus Pristimantibacillus lignocellulolyticus]